MFLFRSKLFKTNIIILILNLGLGFYNVNAQPETNRCKTAKGNAAIEACTELINVMPKKVNTYDSRGNSINSNQQAISAYNSRGKAWLDKGEFQIAIGDFTEAIGLDLTKSISYYNRGLARSFNEQIDQAIEDYSQAIKLDNKYAPAYLSRGIALVNKGQISLAISDFNETIRNDPKNSMGYFNRGNAFCKKGEAKKAEIDFKEALRLDPNNEIFKNRIAELIECIDVERNNNSASTNNQITPQEQKDLIVSERIGNVSEKNGNDIGASKSLGGIIVTLKEGKVSKSRADINFLFENTNQKPELISAFLIESISNEGDKGKLEFNETDCNGTIPPMGRLKCKLVYYFEAAPSFITVKVGSGILSKSVFFKLE